MHRERFAPSPTGPLHLGHAFSALIAFERAKSLDGEFLLRIEDIDQSRSRPEWESQIFDDLAWLGLRWETPVLRQSARADAYQAALDQLRDAGLIYPCACNRRDILAAANAPQEGVEPMTGPDSIIYPGTCKMTPAPRTNAAWRLDISKAFQHLAADQLTYIETNSGAPISVNISATSMIATVGDFVVARRDMGTSYHLAVVVDDAFQAITHVTRGEDLAEATALHVLLQKLLALPTPVYHHHRLIRDDTNKRLAKRDDARSLQKFREEGMSPSDIRRLVGLN